MKNTPSSVTVQAGLRNQRPVLLLEIGIGSGSTLNLCMENANVTFGGTVYSAKAISMSNMSMSSEGSISSLSVKIDNADRSMAAYVAQDAFAGRPLVAKRVYLDAISGSTYYNEVFSGTVEGTQGLDKRWFSLQATSDRRLHYRGLTNYYTKHCRHAFGDDDCNHDGLSDLTSSAMYSNAAVSSGATDYMVLSSGTSGAVDDYWNYGRIKVGKDGVTYIRTVLDYTTGTSRVDFNVELPVSVDNSYRYEVWKGCPKTLDACTAAFNYGPSGNNGDNFGGFIHIGERLNGVV